MKAILGFLFFLFLFWMLWFFSDGPNRSNYDGPYIKPLPPVGTGETYWK